VPKSTVLLSLACASPPHQFLQAEVGTQARRLFGPKFRDFERLFPVFRNTGIRSRQAVKPMEWYFQDRSWPERTAAYLEGAVDLFCDAASQALEGAGLEPGDVDTIVTVSSTGIATPSLEARAMGRLAFREDVMRVPVFGLGCAGGVTGLSVAGRLAQARPGSIVLLVAVELCTLACRLDEMTSANIVADVDRFVCHPGGAKVIEAFEKSLDLGQGALTWEREVLSDHGNMSAPTALFVLERALAAKARGQLVLTALGPGFTASCVSMAA
jgi:predicted naringenin-chalcone synthase